MRRPIWFGLIAVGAVLGFLLVRHWTASGITAATLSAPSCGVEMTYANSDLIFVGDVSGTGLAKEFTYAE